MQNILLIGLGRFGQYTAMKLSELNQSVMAVDINEDHVNKVLNYVTNAQIGDSTDEDFLKSLGIGNYDTCIVAIGDDFLASLETTALLKDMGAKHIISRATSTSQEKFLLRNGADEVIFPEKQLAIWTAIHCSSASISNYIELSNGYSIYEIQIPEGWVGKTIGSLDVRRHYGINILGTRVDGNLSMEINAETTLAENSTLLVLGKEKEIVKCFHLQS